MNYEFFGKHLIVEGYGIQSEDLNNVDLFLSLFNKGIKKADVTNCGVLVKKFDPIGMTIIILLAESHISIHTYPEKGAFFLDIFTCGRTNPNIIFKEIEDYFSKRYGRSISFVKKILERRR